MNKEKVRTAQVGHAWGILLGMAAVPVLALLNKVFPNLYGAWAVLLILAGILVVRSFIGYLFPAAFSRSAKAPAARAPGQHAVAQSR